MTKVLVVSSDDLAPEFGKTLLWGPGIERVFASSPAAGLEVARSFVPSLVVLDACDAGFELTTVRRFRESPGARRASLVVYAPPALEGSALLEAGANLVLSGSIDPESWNPTLQRLLTVPKRIRLRVPVRLTPPDGPSRDATLVDLSTRGMLVEAERPFAAGDRFDVRFALPDSPAELGAVATVVRSFGGTSCGCALRFDALLGDAEARLLAFAAQVPARHSLGRYEIVSILGEGAMGTVYRAFDPLAQRSVAVKTLRPEQLARGTAAEALQRFRREAQAAAKLVHPNIVTIYDVGEDYFVMELIEGETLEARLHERGALPREDVLRWLEPVAEALDHAHEQGVIHRDVKPGNIMLLPDGSPRVMDFGVAHLTTSSTVTAQGEVFGSPAYMAPEQITHEQVGRPADLFSLAAVAYEALTGHRAFGGEAITPTLHKVLYTDPELPTRWRPDLPESYDAIFRKALSKNPAARFPNARAFAAALRRAEAPGPESADTLDLTRSPERPRRRRSRRWLVALPLTCAALAVAALVYLRGTAGPQTRAVAPRAGLHITTNPAGARVLMDGVEMGVSPLVVLDPRPGWHSMRVEHDGYVAATLSIDVSAAGVSYPLTFVMQPETGLLSIDSVPSGAHVFLDGEPAGVTPLAALPVAPGSHEVRLESDGFRRWATRFEARPTQRAQISATLEAMPAARGPKAPAWVRLGDLVELGPGVTPPRRLDDAPVPYPEAARKLRLRGTVVVRFVVSEEGRVLEPRIVESAGDILDAAMLRAVSARRYAPAESNDVRVRVRIREQRTFGASDGPP